MRVSRCFVAFLLCLPHVVQGASNGLSTAAGVVNGSMTSRSVDPPTSTTSWIAVTTGNVSAPGNSSSNGGDACRLLTSCRDCAGDRSCVWCSETTECVAGDMFGPSGQYGTCGWQWAQCTISGFAAVAIPAGGALGLLVAVVVAGCCCCWCRRRKKRWELKRRAPGPARDDEDEEEVAKGRTPVTDAARRALMEKYGIRPKQLASPGDDGFGASATEKTPLMSDRPSSRYEPLPPSWLESPPRRSTVLDDALAPAPDVLSPRTPARDDTRERPRAVDATPSPTPKADAARAQLLEKYGIRPRQPLEPLPFAVADPGDRQAARSGAPPNVPTTSTGARLLGPPRGEAAAGAQAPKPPLGPARQSSNSSGSAAVNRASASAAGSDVPRPASVALPQASVSPPGAARSGEQPKPPGPPAVYYPPDANPFDAPPPPPALAVASLRPAPVAPTHSVARDSRLAPAPTPTPAVDAGRLGSSPARATGPAASRPAPQPTPQPPQFRVSAPPAAALNPFESDAPTHVESTSDATNPFDSSSPPRARGVPQPSSSAAARRASLNPFEVESSPALSSSSSSAKNPFEASGDYTVQPTNPFGPAEFAPPSAAARSPLELHVSPRRGSQQFSTGGGAPLADYPPDANPFGSEEPPAPKSAGPGSGGPAAPPPNPFADDYPADANPFGEPEPVSVGTKPFASSSSAHSARVVPSGSASGASADDSTNPFAASPPAPAKGSSGTDDTNPFAASPPPPASASVLRPMMRSTSPTDAAAAASSGRAKLLTSSDGNGDAPDSILCPITSEVMREPAMLVSCGHTFERRAVESWLLRSPRCPVCSQPAESRQLQVNFFAKGLIEEWLSKHDGA